MNHSTYTVFPSRIPAWSAWDVYPTKENSTAGGVGEGGGWGGGAVGLTVGLEVGWLVGEKLGATLEGLLVTVTVGESVGETVESNVGEEVGLQVTYAAKTSPSVPPQPVSSDITLFKKTKLGMQIVLCIQTGFCVYTSNNKP